MNIKFNTKKGDIDDMTKKKTDLRILEEAMRQLGKKGYQVSLEIETLDEVNHLLDQSLSKKIVFAFKDDVEEAFDKNGKQIQDLVLNFETNLKTKSIPIISTLRFNDVVAKPNPEAVDFEILIPAGKKITRRGLGA